MQYKKQSSGVWLDALDLLRTYEYTWKFGTGQADTPANHFTGSLFFLEPGTAYDIRLTLTEGVTTYQSTYQRTTRALPVMPNPGTVRTATPATLSGILSTTSPGDRVQLENGTYSAFTISRSGSAGAYVVFEPAAGHSPVISGISLEASYIWLSGLTVTNPTPDTWTPSSAPSPPTPQPGTYNGQNKAIDASGAVGTLTDVVITDCTVSGFYQGIFTGDVAVANWTVSDNTLVGSHAAGSWENSTVKSGGGANAIWLGAEGKTGGPGCVVSYNSVTRFEKSFLVNGDCDVYGNDSFDTRGSVVTTDAVWQNVRVWGNRLSSCAGWAFSFQPQKSGPWYYLYNQVADFQNTWKWNCNDRNVFINNTFYDAQTVNSQHFMRCYMRNNIFIRNNTGVLWQSSNESSAGNVGRDLWSANWMTDVDYDGFGHFGGNIYSWNGNSSYQSDITLLYAESGSGTTRLCSMLSIPGQVDRR
jgi:hypothetical protein